MKYHKIVRWYKPNFGWVHLPKPLKITELTISCLMRLGYTDLIIEKDGMEKDVTAEHVLNKLVKPDDDIPTS